MKKLIQITTLFLLVVSVSTTHAGVNETKVLDLLKQSVLFNKGLTGTENVGFNFTVTNVTTETGKKTLRDTVNFTSLFAVTTDAVNMSAKVEGNMKVTASTGENISLPLSVVYQKDTYAKEYFYLFMFPQYSSLIRMVSGGEDLIGKYDNTWQRIDLSELSTSTSPTTPDSVRSQITDAMILDAGIFKATSKKVGLVTTYTVKLNGPQIIAQENKKIIASGRRLTAEELKDQQELLTFIKNTTFTLTEKGGKLTGLTVTLLITEKKSFPTYMANGKKGTYTTTTTTNVTFRDTPQAFQTFAVPTQYQQFSPKTLLQSVMGTSTLR